MRGRTSRPERLYPIYDLWLMASASRGAHLLVQTMKTAELLCVVDDDESVRDAVSGLLRSIGFLVTALDSAEALLGSPVLGEVRCLILDVRMPGMKGPQLQQQLTASGRAIPIIFITAQRSTRLRDDVLRAGAIACLPKPVHEGALVDAVHEALGSVREEEER